MCSQTCGPDGTSQRSRTCINDGAYGGVTCDQDPSIEGPVPCNTEILCAGIAMYIVFGFRLHTH